MHRPFLIGENIYLRAVEEADLAGDYFQWFNDPQVCRYTSHATFPYTMTEALDYWKRTQGSRTEVVLAIVTRQDDRHVGNVALKTIDWIARSAELAIIIGNKDYWGQDVGTEAGQLLIDYAFTRLNLQRVHCGTHEENVGMRKLALRLGMVEEGRRRKAIFKNGAFADVIEYGIVRDSR